MARVEENAKARAVQTISARVVAIRIRQLPVLQLS